MLLTDAPNLPLVIGLPMGLMLGSFILGAATWVVMTRLRRGREFAPHEPAPSQQAGGGDAATTAQ